MKNGEKGPMPSHDVVSLEKRRHPRWNVDLPVEYWRRDLVVKHDRVINASETGLLTYLSEQVEVGQHLRIRVFFPFRSGLGSIEMVTEVVWMESQPNRRGGDFRTGVRFIDVSPEALFNLKAYLGSISR